MSPTTTQPRPVGFVRRALWSGLVTQPTIDRAHQAHTNDVLGARVHLTLACLFCALVAAPMSVVEFAGIPLGIAWAVRIVRVWPVTRFVFVLPLFFCATLWAAWQFVALTWSREPGLGIEQMGALRWAWILLALYPVLDRRRDLVIALACGYLVANGVQALHFVGAQVGWEAVTFGRMPDRYSGWWQPVVGGSMLVGALGLHIGPALMGRGRTQVLGAAGAGLTLLGIIATGSRGAWLGAGGLVAIAIVVAAVTIRPRRRQVRVMGSAMIVGLVAGVVAWLAIGPSIERRFDRAREEITGAIEEKEFTTDTGARLLMWWWSVEAMGERPLRGVGTGGYHDWVVEHLEDQGIDPASRSIHDHAHNAYLHIGATTGLVGLALGGLVVVVALRGALAGLDRTRLGTYEAGPLFAIAGLMLVGAFDSVHVNAQSSALLVTLFALCQHPRPRRTVEGGA